MIDVFTKYAWAKSLKDEKGETVLNPFAAIVNESDHKPNKLWVENFMGNLRVEITGREFHNKVMQERLDNNDILMQSTQKVCKSAILKGS